MDTPKNDQSDALPQAVQVEGSESALPRNEEERRIYQLVKEAIDADQWTGYASVKEILDDLTDRARTPKK